MSERPLCKCHGEPMLRDGFWRGKQKWQCGVRERQRQRDLYQDPAHAQHKRLAAREHYEDGGGREARRDRYHDRKARGLCTKCGEPSLSDTLCWGCLNKLEEHYAVRI